MGHIFKALLIYTNEYMVANYIIVKNKNNMVWAQLGGFICWSIIPYNNKRVAGSIPGPGIYLPFFDSIPETYV